MTQLHLFSYLKANFQAFGGWIAKTATFGKLAALTPLAVAGWFIAQELKSEVVTIEPIEVPKTLSDSGYTPGVAGHRLRDALNAYAGAPAPGDDRTALNSNLDSVAHDDDSLNSNLDLSISAGRELPDIVVPQIGLSLRAIASSIRSGLGITGHAISGELTRQDSKYALRLRIDGRQVFNSGYEAENPDDLMTRAAPAVMEIIRPAAHAMARYRDQKDEALLKANEIIAHYDKSDINVQWAYLLKGKHALRRDNYREAEEMFSKAVSSNANSEQPHIQLGVSLLRGSRPEDAIKQFERVLAINPKSAIAHNNIGVALATQANRNKPDLDAAKLKQAIAKYEQAIAIEPGYALPYNNLGLALSHLDLVEEAIGRYRSAINIAPQYMFARWNLAYALQRQRNFNAAANEYRAAITHATNAKQRAMLHTFIGDVLEANKGEYGNIDEAVQEYRNAVEIVYPDCYGWAHHNLGRIRQDQGKMNDAIAEFDKAATCEPENPTFRDNLKQALRVQDAGATTTGHGAR
jgi:tetratricopeptide (TPR) repeat protein